MTEEYYNREKLDEYINKRNMLILANTRIHDNYISILNDEKKNIIILTDKENIDLIIQNNRKKSINQCGCKTKETYEQETESMFITFCSSCKKPLLYEKKIEKPVIKEDKVKVEEKRVKKEKIIKDDKDKKEKLAKKIDITKLDIEVDTIYNENNMNTCARMKDGIIPLIVTSPPYDGMRKYKGYVFDFEPLAKELSRILMPGGVIMWNVNDQFIDGSKSLTSFKQAIYFVEECGLKLHDHMIYAKYSAAYQNDNTKRYSQCFEHVFILVKGNGGPNTANLFKNKNREGALRIIDNRCFPLKGTRNNIWFYTPGLNSSAKETKGRKQKIKHPAIMPEDLAKDHVLSWSNEGDVVYDPFSGSGTTAKVCKLTGRYYIGSEISDEYYKDSIERLNNINHNQIQFETVKEKEDIFQPRLF